MGLTDRPDGKLRSWRRPSDAVTKTARWKALRIQALRRDGFQCCACGARGRLEVHHIKPVRSHPELGFDLANLKCLCGPCHNAETRRELGQAPTSPERKAWRQAVRQLSLETTALRKCDA